MAVASAVRARVEPARWQPYLCVGVFCVLAFALYGGGSPVSTHDLPACACGDAAQEVWFLAWPGYAIAHGHNPLFSNFVAYPRGINLMSSTSMPLLGVLGAPVSLTLGPVASFNLLMMLAPILSASSMLFVLRRWVRWWPAAFAGALLYGFSPFVFAEGHSHLFLTFLALPPLIVLLLDELLVRQQRSARLTGALLGLVATAQLLISAEVLVVVTLMAAFGLVLVALRHSPAARVRVRAAGPGLAAAVVVFGVLAGYPLYMYLAGAQHLAARQHPTIVYRSFYDDLLGAIVPTKYQLLGLNAWKRAGDSLAQGDLVDHPSYLGAPLLIALAYFGWKLRREAIVAVATVVGAVALVLTLGPTLHIDRAAILGGVLPFGWLLHVPVLDGVLAPRFAIVVYLAAAIVLAVGLDRLRAQARLLASAVAVTVLLPVVPSAAYVRAPANVPALFSGHAIDRVPSASVLLPYPNAQEPSTTVVVAPETRSMLWQAAAGMRFRMIGAYAAQPGLSGLGQGDQLLLAPKAVQRFFGWAYYGQRAVPDGRPSARLPAELRQFCRRFHVGTIAVDPTAGVDPGAVVRYVGLALGRAPQRVGGVDVWFDAARVAR